MDHSEFERLKMYLNYQMNLIECQFLNIGLFQVEIRNNVLPKKIIKPAKIDVMASCFNIYSHFLNKKNLFIDTKN